MAANFEAESTLTDRYQTTVPETVRRALRLGKRDKIHYRISGDGEVVMSRALAEVDWDDLTEAAPVAVTAVTMPLTYSIAVGLGLGFITYVVVKVLTRRWEEISPAVWLLAAVFAVMLPLL